MFLSVAPIRTVTVRCDNSNKKSFLPDKVQRLRREMESKRIEKVKKIQDVIRETAEDDLESLLAFVRDKDSSDKQQ